MARLYRLIGRLPVPCDDVREWLTAMHGARTTVGYDLVEGVHVLTMFHSIDQSDGDPPRLFETMIWGGHTGGNPVISAWRSTWGEAETMHADALERVRGWIANAAAWTADLRPG
jgi:hypothetical protein